MTLLVFGWFLSFNAFRAPFVRSFVHWFLIRPLLLLVEVLVVVVGGGGGGGRVFIHFKPSFVLTFVYSVAFALILKGD